MKYSLTPILIFLSIFSYSQLEDFQLRGTLLPLGASAEFAIGNQVSFDVNAGLQPGYSYSSYSINGQEVESTSDFILTPNIAGGFRYYYNFLKREDQGLKTTGNSANYIALTSNYLITEYDEEDKVNILMVGPAWGLQRTYNSNIYLDLTLGLGYLHIDEVEDDEESFGTIGPVFNFKLGYAILR